MLAVGLEWLSHALALGSSGHAACTQPGGCVASGLGVGHQHLSQHREMAAVEGGQGGTRCRHARSVSHKTPSPASAQTPSNLPRSQ
jgi:hypothetical protein